MTTPIAQDDIVQGCAKMLTQKLDVVAALGTDSEGNVLLRQYGLWMQMEGTQSTAAVIGNDGGWAGPNLHNTLRFPRITVDVYADPRRDAGGNLRDPGEVRRRINHAYQVIDRYLHRPEGGAEMWGSIRTLACARTIEPVITSVPDGGGLLRLFVAYGVTEG